MTWDWLVYKYPQHVDFYLPEFNTAIECQGLQHFTGSNLFDKTEPLEVRVERDINKQKLCLQNGIRILYYSNLSTKNKKFNYPYLVFEDLNKLILEAKNPLLL